jgi:Flp pilus assembly protein TadG
MSKLKTNNKKIRRSAGNSRSIVRRFIGDESGNVIMWVCFVMLTMMCISAFAVDLVHAMVVDQQLQASADASALAAAEVPANYPTVGHAYTLGSTNAGAFSAGSGDKNSYNGISLTTNTVTPLCLNTVAGWSKTTCGTGSAPNAMRVTQATTVPTFFARVFGWNSFTPSVISTATVQGATPLPYNVAILVDSTLSMAAQDGSTYCSGMTQEQCALQGIQALLGSGGSGSYGLAPSVDNVALFTFPNVLSTSQAGVTSGGSWGCTTNMPSSYTDSKGNKSTYDSSGSGSSKYYYSMLGATWSSGSGFGSGWQGTNQVPYPGVAWGMPYTFPSIPSGASASYAPASGGATYEVVPFENGYRTSDAATSLATSDPLVEAVGGNSSCGGVQPSNYDGNYGTYYAGAMYAAQAALVAEQKSNGYPNVMIILGDGNNNGPSDSQSPDSNSPSVGQTSAEITSTYSSPSQLTYTPAGNSAAYTYPSGWLTASNTSGTYPSATATCSQAVVAANTIKTYSPRSTAIYTVAYGSPSTSSSSNCGYDRTSAATYRNITPCETLQWMATGGSSTETTPSNYFYSDYTVTGGDPDCQANSANNSVNSLVDIFHSIASSLTRVRLIPNSTT